MKLDLKNNLPYIGILLIACVSVLIILLGTLLFKGYEVEILIFVLVLMAVMYLVFFLQGNRSKSNILNEYIASKEKD